MKAPIHIAILFILLALLSGCGRQDESITLKVYHGGNEYLILDRGDLESGGEHVYYVRYLSSDPSNKTVLDAECADLYAIISKHIDTNRHQRVLLEAVGRKGRFFGLAGPSETAVVSTVEEVMDYKPDEINPPQEAP